MSWSEPPHRSVRPIDRRNSVSPANSSGVSPPCSRKKQIEPGVCPGVCSARGLASPEGEHLVAAQLARRAAGGGARRARQAEHRRLHGRVVVQPAIAARGSGSRRRCARGDLAASAMHVIEVRVRVHDLDGAHARARQRRRGCRAPRRRGRRPAPRWVSGQATIVQLQPSAPTGNDSRMSGRAAAVGRRATQRRRSGTPLTIITTGLRALGQDLVGHAGDVDEAPIGHGWRGGSRGRSRWSRATTGVVER